MPKIVKKNLNYLLSRLYSQLNLSNLLHYSPLSKIDKNCPLLRQKLSSPPNCNVLRFIYYLTPTAFNTVRSFCLTGNGVGLHILRVWYPIYRLSSYIKCNATKMPNTAVKTPSADNITVNPKVNLLSKASILVSNLSL